MSKQVLLKSNRFQKQKLTHTIKKEKWHISLKNTKAGLVPVVNDKISWSDKFGEFKARTGINRHNYRINPGLYAIGNPDENGTVIVTSNYKLTFDKVRASLKGVSAWILVLDTKGVNVWCAAGKGTFGTSELIKRIESTRLKEVVNHRTLILPQLGAPGMAGFEVTKKTGFSIKYGPVYAKDLVNYINRSFVKLESEKIINFSFIDRLVLTPIEIKSANIPNLIALLIFFALYTLKSGSISFKFLNDFLPFYFSTIAGGLLFPLLLPVLPFRSFALKGAILGIVYSMFILFITKASGFSIAGTLLLYVPIISFMALNFTGCSTFTSLSGVKKEIKIATPIYIVGFTAGIIIKLLEGILQKPN